MVLFDLLLEFEEGSHVVIEARVFQFGTALAGLTIFVNTLAESARFVTKFDHE